MRNLERVCSLCSLKWTSLFSGSSTATCDRSKNQLEKKLSCTKHRSRRPEVATAKLEHPKGPGEVSISVADDRELDALQ